MIFSKVLLFLLLILITIDELHTQKPPRGQKRLNARTGKGQNGTFNRNKDKQFLRQVERHLSRGKPIFTEKAMHIIQKNGWSNSYFKLPHQSLEKAFGFCDIPREFDVKKMFPGLFRSETESRNLPDMKAMKLTVPYRNWHGTAALTINIPSDIDHQPEVLSNSGLIGISHSNNGTRQETTASQSRGQLPNRGFICNCCKVSRYLKAYSDIYIEKKTYKVIDFGEERQFVAIEECPKVNRCEEGGCIQRYTTNHILIWNETKPYYPALDFAPLEVPTHCEWASIRTP